MSLARRPDPRLSALDLGFRALGVLAAAMLVAIYGLPEGSVPRGVRLAWSVLLPLGLYLEVLLRLLWVADPLRHLGRHPARFILLLVITLEISGVASWSAGGIERGASFVATEIYVAISMLGFLGHAAKGAILANRWLALHRIPVLAMPAITFAAMIAIGTALLALPGLQRRPLPLLDQLFTATSALCVTGLSTYDVGSCLHGSGLVVLAALIQIGGLGTLTVIGWLTLWQRGKITLAERAVFADLVATLPQAEMKNLLRTVLVVTFTMEIAGAIALGLLWRERVPHSIPSGAFHAVSAFCNAGFSLFPDNFAGFGGDTFTLGVAGLLIVAGGLGFPVLDDLTRAAVSRALPWAENRPLKRASRVALAATAILLAVGTAAYLVDGMLQGAPRSVAAALFQSLTTRTAGFQVESQFDFAAFGVAATIALMAIGACTQSTGGGVKATVVARFFVRDEATGVMPAAGLAGILVLTYAAIGAGATFLFVEVEGLPLQDAAFEAFSALGTVGLTRDVTANLSDFGKCVDIALMFTGRVLFPTFVIGLTRRRPIAADPIAWT